MENKLVTLRISKNLIFKGIKILANFNFSDLLNTYTNKIIEMRSHHAVSLVTRTSTCHLNDLTILVIFMFYFYLWI